MVYKINCRTHEFNTAVCLRSETIQMLTFVLDALNNKLCDATNSVHVFNIAFNAMFVGTKKITSSA